MKTSWVLALASVAALLACGGRTESGDGDADADGDGDDFTIPEPDGLVEHTIDNGG